MNQHIFPSIMGKSQKEIDALFVKLKGVAKVLHLDIADGKAVPNTSLNFPLRLPRIFHYQAHLMMNDPESWMEKHAKKMDLCIPQWEVVFKKYHTDCMNCCYFPCAKKFAKKIAFALRPETSVHELRPYLAEIDYVLILTVHPGFYGGKFLPASLKKIKQLKRWNPKLKIIVDGGMDPSTIKKAAQAGADHFVSGSFVSNADDPKKAYRILHKAAFGLSKSL